MQIDISHASKFGNLVGGGGLGAAFDGNVNTIAYAESSVGYVGVSLPSAKRIERLEVVSAANGFDASGLTTGITLQLYGKKGAAPVSSTDGVVIGVASFTDQNVQRTVALQSNDKATLFDHVWLRLSTGVWSVVADFRLFEAPEPAPIPEPEPLPSGPHVFIKSCDQNVGLVSTGIEISQFRTRFYLAEPRKVLLDFHADVIHVGNGSDAAVAVGFSFWLAKRSGGTLQALDSAAFVSIRNAVGGGNVSERNPQHYGNKSICSAIELDAGYHEFSVIGNGHTDGSSTQGLLQVLAEGGMGLNCLRVVVLP